MVLNSFLRARGCYVRQSMCSGMCWSWCLTVSSQIFYLSHSENHHLTFMKYHLKYNAKQILLWYRSQGGIINIHVRNTESDYVGFLNFFNICKPYVYSASRGKFVSYYLDSAFCLLYTVTFIAYFVLFLLWSNFKMNCLI